jgi:gamma-glutamylcyclotransferase (GGCT)/AIG2-like uncharacterized protein YtfP
MTHEKLNSAYESEMLQAFALKYATRLSYQKASELVSERTGTSSLSEQRIYKIVEAQAAELVAEQAQMIRQASAEGEPIKAVEVDIYNAQTKEVMWFGDGICVCQQKAKRDSEAKKGKERTTTEMAMIERKDGGYRTIIAGEGIDRVELYRAEVVREYGAEAGNLPIVAITDGARNLKKEATEVFGKDVCHILDWYHLEAKVYQLMTQIAPNKQVKEASQELIIGELWRGESEKAIRHLEKIQARNHYKRDELKGYLEKNKDYIINYERRKEAKKVIGSGRMEKQNDVIVANRQKRKGMSWSKSGSRNLAIVTAHLNQGTNYLQ